ncbi:MAG TPA: helix-turn-helix domain-containing protein [Solirubrobacter sp.]|nr:helix-turn-helix domain-containing protein [Solirubrobacter sp.]
MDLPARSSRDLLALPLRADLFQTLARLCRPASTQELAEILDRHPNTVRAQLGRLADAGLLERRTMPQRRGRPRDEWAIAPDARPGGRSPEAHAQLSVWLTRALAGSSRDLAAVEATGRAIGRELAAEGNGEATSERIQDTLAALGFAPHTEPRGGDAVRIVLRNCPYRAAAQQDPRVVCTLHRGITAGMLDRLAPTARLTDFVARDPVAAGCLVDIAGV